MILITGVTGRTGKEVAKTIAAKNIPVRAIARDPGKAQDIAALGIEVVQADMQDEASLVGALEGVTKAFLMMANVEAQLDNEKRFIDAAHKASVSHVVKLSSHDAGPDSKTILKRYHGLSEQYIEQSGLDYTFVKPNFFMQYMLMSMPTIEAENKIFLPGGTGKTGPIDLRDVAEVITMALTEEGHVNKSYIITGPEQRSYADLAADFSVVLGREITYVDVPPAAFKEELLGYGENEWVVNAVLEEFQQMASNDGAFVTDTYEELTGRKPRSFKQFLRETLG